MLSLIIGCLIFVAILLKHFEILNKQVDIKLGLKDIQNTNLYLKIVCEDEKYMPTYATENDACMDLKIKIESEKKGEEIINSEKCYLLKPGETHAFNTGIKVSIPEGHIMMIFPRSSTGFKLHCMLTNTTGIIDAGYRDEVKIAVTNFGKEPIYLKDAQRIAQFVIVPRPKINLLKVEDDEKFREGDRGGGIGSTGEK